MEVKVKICNAAVCSTTDSISVKVCQENGDERDDNIANVLLNVRTFLFSQQRFLLSFGLTFFLRPKMRLEQTI